MFNIQILYLINMVCGCAIFVHCACRLSLHRFAIKQPELWAYALMLAGSVGVVAGPVFDYRTPPPPEMVLNMGITIYFMASVLRARRLKNKGVKSE